MRLLIDATTTQDQFAYRGVGRVTWDVISHMVEQSISKRRDDEYLLLLFEAESTLDYLVEKYPQVVRTVRLGKLRLSGKLDELWWNFQYRPAIKRMLCKKDPDLYFCPYFWRGFPTCPEKELPTVVMIHDLALPILGRYSAAPKCLDWIRKLQYHRWLDRLAGVTGIITNSENTKKDVMKYVPGLKGENVRAVHLGLRESIEKVESRREVLANYMPEEAIDAGYILYWGGIQYNKNVHTLVRAYSELMKRWDESDGKLPYLVLIGGEFTRKERVAPELADLESVISETGVSERVVLSGRYEDEHANDLLCGARMFTHLSLYEGFGFSPLEAMRCGIPVVASNRSCYPEVLGDGASLVDPDDLDAVVGEFRKVLTDEDYAEKLGEAGQKQASKYTWDKTAEEYYEFFEEIVGKGKEQ